MLSNVQSVRAMSWRSTIDSVAVNADVNGAVPLQGECVIVTTGRPCVPWVNAWNMVGSPPTTLLIAYHRAPALGMFRSSAVVVELLNVVIGSGPNGVLGSGVEKSR